MPVKKRKAKRRLAPEIEAEAWAAAFATSHDFFGDLKPFGLETSDQVRAAAPVAWARLGRIFLDLGLGDGFNGENWAHTEFGDP